MKKIFLASGVPNPRWTGSVTYWPPESESLILFMKDSQKFQEKIRFTIYLTTIFCQMPQKYPGRMRIRIRNSGLLIRGSGSVRNIYGSGTLLENGCKYTKQNKCVPILEFSRFVTGGCWTDIEHGERSQRRQIPRQAKPPLNREHSCRFLVWFYFDMFSCFHLLFLKISATLEYL